MKPNCFNRPGYKDTVTVQDGWCAIWLKDDYDGQAMIKTCVPRMKTIPDPMSKTCQQHSPHGAATIYGWDCGGCKHKPEATQ